jgi:hypothetical protein
VVIFGICLLLILAYLGWEKFRLRGAQAALPWRIHVYGTRGKTTLTRLLIQLLRTQGFRVLGRTSGDAPVICHPDGRESRQPRLGPPNIHEYISCLAQARDGGCQAIVMECMALHPANIHSCREILAPTHVFITNTRPDHHESQGERPEDIVRALSLSLGPGQRVFALEDAGAACLRQRAERVNSVLSFSGAAEQTIAPNRMAATLANALAEELRLNPLPLPSPQWPAFQRLELSPEQSCLFLDLFSVNDVVSTAQLLEQARRRAELDAAMPLLGLLSTRSDRPLRTKAFVDWLIAAKPCSHYLAVGDHAWFAWMRLARHGRMLAPPLFRHSVFTRAGLLAWAKALGIDGQTFALVGLGNSHGYGQSLRRAQERKEQ